MHPETFRRAFRVRNCHPRTSRAHKKMEQTVRSLVHVLFIEHWRHATGIRVASVHAAYDVVFRMPRSGCERHELTLRPSGGRAASVCSSGSAPVDAGRGYAYSPCARPPAILGWVVPSVCRFTLAVGRVRPACQQGTPGSMRPLVRQRAVTGSVVQSGVCASDSRGPGTGREPGWPGNGGRLRRDACGCACPGCASCRCPS